MKTIQELAEIGAKAATNFLGSYMMLVNDGHPNYGGERESKAREAFAQAVIDAFLDGIGDVPSVDECTNLFAIGSITVYGPTIRSGVECVRSAIAAAYEAKLAKAGNKEMEAYEALCAENQKLHSTLSRATSLEVELGATREELRQAESRLAELE